MSVENTNLKGIILILTYKQMIKKNITNLINKMKIQIYKMRRKNFPEQKQSRRKNKQMTVLININDIHRN